MMPPPGASFRYFVEQEIGKFPHFVLYALPEWTLIGILFLDSFIEFAASEFAKFFDLEPPCLLYTRIDHIFACRTSSSGYICYNQSICEFHKRDMSSLAFCDLHRRLSDLQRMCERCLLSFSTAADAAAANSARHQGCAEIPEATDQLASERRRLGGDKKHLGLLSPSSQAPPPPLSLPQNSN